MGPTITVSGESFGCTCGVKGGVEEGAIKDHAWSHDPPARVEVAPLAQTDERALMADLVLPEKIEGIVGAKREPLLHMARAVSSEQTVYILHSQGCLARGKDLRECEHTKAMERGIDRTEWEGFEDVPVVVAIRGGRLAPLFGPRRRKTGPDGAQGSTPVI